MASDVCSISVHLLSLTWPNPCTCIPTTVWGFYLQYISGWSISTPSEQFGDSIYVAIPKLDECDGHQKWELFSIFMEWLFVEEGVSCLGVKAISKRHNRGYSVRFKSLVDSWGVDHATSAKKLLPQLSYSSFTSHFIIHRWESKQDRHSTMYFAWQDIQFTRYHHNGCFKWIENPALSSRSLVFFRYFCDKELFLIPTFLLLRLPSFWLLCILDFLPRFFGWEEINFQRDGGHVVIVAHTLRTFTLDEVQHEKKTLREEIRSPN